MARSCIFCGGPGPLTRDHVLTRRAAKHIRTRRGALTFRNIRFSQDGTSTEFETENFEVAPKVLCERTCNSGWLERLEDGAWPIMEPLIEGRTRTLSIRRQKILAALITAKVMVAEFAGENPWGTYFTEAERRALYRDRNHSPPGNIWVWIGGTTSELAGHTEGLHARWNRDDGNVRAYLAFLALDRLVMAVFAHRFRERTRWLFPIGESVAPIWPTDGEKKGWPPPLPLDEKTIEAWKQRLGEIDPEILGEG